MSTTRVKSGDVTVTLTGDLEAWVQRATVAAGGEILRAVREEAEGVARTASSRWYDLVNRKTGMSGQIRVVETVDWQAATITVSVGSTDRRIAGKKNAPVPALVHTGGPDSLMLVPVDRLEYFATPKKLRWRYPQVFKVNPKRQPKSQILLRRLVIEPMESALGPRLGEIERRVAAAAERA